MSATWDEGCLAAVPFGEKIETTCGKPATSFVIYRYGPLAAVIWLCEEHYKMVTHHEQPR